MNRNNVLAFAMGPIALAALGVMYIPLASWVFAIEDIGRFSIFQTTLSFGVLLCVLGLDQAYVREYHEESDKASLLRACFVPGFIVLIILLLCTAYFSREISIILFSEDNPWVYWITIISIIIAYLNRFLSLVLRMQERGTAYSLSQVIPKFLQMLMIISIGLLVLDRNFLHLQFTALLSILFTFLLYMWITKDVWRLSLNATIDKDKLKKYIYFGAPLILSGISYWMLVATGTIFLAARSTLDEVGFYSVAVAIAGAASVLQSIFSVVWAPVVYKWVAEQEDMSKVDTVTKQLLAIVCILYLLCGTFSWVIDILMPANFGNIKYLLMCSLVQPLLYTLSEVTGVGINIARRTYFSVVLTFLALLTNIGLCYILVPTYGAGGAVIANAVSFLVFFIGRTEISARVWRSSPRTKLYTFVVLMIFFSIFVVSYSFVQTIDISLICSVILPVVVYVFRLQLSELTLLMYGNRVALVKS